MIEQLLTYAKKKGLAGPGFRPKLVKWCIVCDVENRDVGIQEMGDTSLKKNPGREFAVCPETPAMNAPGKSHILVESLDTVLFRNKKIEEEESKKTIAELKKSNSAWAKLRAKHEFFVNGLIAMSEVVPEAQFAAEVLKDEETRIHLYEELVSQKAKPTTDKITFHFPNRAIPFLVDDPVWHDWWLNFRTELRAASAKPASKSKKLQPNDMMRCFATGEMVEPAKTHEKITELADVGASSMGAPLISFNKDSLCSYGLQDSFNAAMSEEATAAYRMALNNILANSSVRLPGIKVGYWFDKKVPKEVEPMSLISDPASSSDEKSVADEQDERDALGNAKKFLQSLRSGDRPDQERLRKNRYYALTLSGNAGRVMIRDWMTGHFEELLENILQWFDDLAITDRNLGEDLAKPPKFYAVLGSLVRDLKDVPSPLTLSLWKSAMQKSHTIPRSALAMAVQRFRVDIMDDKPANHARMGLIRAYHVRQARLKLNDNNQNHNNNYLGEDQMTPGLNKDLQNPAYQCGRLMAVLASVQYAALGDVGAGVVQRYYSAASSTPGLVLGRLTDLSKKHLTKVRRDKPGLAVWFESTLEEIWSKFSAEEGIPPTFTLEDQSLFAMGYYQQKAASRKKQSKEENINTLHSADGE